MPLYSMKEILCDAEKRGYGVGFFNGTSMEMIRGYIRAAEDLHSPIIIGTAEGLLPCANFEWLSPLLLNAAKIAKAPVAVHFDHGYTKEAILKAVDSGFGSVMFDGSALSYEENVKISAELAEIAHQKGRGLECELGKVGGFDEGGVRAKNIYTDPVQAADFAEKTGADFLAVSIGTTHGIYTDPPRLNLNLLAEIRKRVTLPLVLHGGSGLSDDDFKNSIRGGISKINIYTDVVEAAIKIIREECKSLSYTELNVKVENAVYEVTAKKLKLFGSGNKY